MKKKIQLELPKEDLQRLNSIRRLLNVGLSDLVELGCHELFLMIKDDTDIFLKEIGYYKKLQNHVT